MDRLARQNELIANATRTVAETEEVGLEITTELARNREKIESSHAKVGLSTLKFVHLITGFTQIMI